MKWPFALSAGQIACNLFLSAGLAVAFPTLDQFVAVFVVSMAALTALDKAGNPPPPAGAGETKGET